MGRETWKLCISRRTLSHSFECIKFDFKKIQFYPIVSSSSYGGNNSGTNNNNNSNSNNSNGNNNSSNINHAHLSTTSNGPVISSNSLSSSATNATVTSTNGLQHENNFLNQNNVPNGDWICFNFGKELYTYSFRGVKKVRNSEIVAKC